MRAIVALLLGAAASPVAGGSALAAAALPPTYSGVLYCTGSNMYTVFADADGDETRLTVAGEVVTSGATYPLQFVNSGAVPQGRLFSSNLSMRGITDPAASDVVIRLRATDLTGRTSPTYTTIGCRAPRLSTPLRLYWQDDRQDNDSVATPEGVRDAEAVGYRFVRNEGYIDPEGPPGTVPLKLYWNAALGDNLTTATPDGDRSAQQAGYAFVRNEGYVFTTPQAGTVPLYSFVNQARGDYFSTASSEGILSAFSAGYQIVRVEGWVYRADDSVQAVGVPGPWSYTGGGRTSRNQTDPTKPTMAFISANVAGGVNANSATLGPVALDIPNGTIVPVLVSGEDADGLRSVNLWVSRSRTCDNGDGTASSEGPGLLSGPEVEFSDNSPAEVSAYTYRLTNSSVTLWAASNCLDQVVVWAEAVNFAGGKTTSNRITLRARGVGF